MVQARDEELKHRKEYIEEILNDKSKIEEQLSNLVSEFEVYKNSTDKFVHNQNVAGSHTHVALSEKIYDEEKHEIRRRKSLSQELWSLEEDNNQK